MVFNLPNMLTEENNKKAKSPNTLCSFSVFSSKSAHLFPVCCLLLLLLLSLHNMLTVEVAALHKSRTWVCVQAASSTPSQTSPLLLIAHPSLPVHRPFPAILKVCITKRRKFSIFSPFGCSFPPLSCSLHQATKSIYQGHGKKQANPSELKLKREERQ